MTNEIEQLERISILIDNYLESFERARIALYSFPSLEAHCTFKQYLNSFTSALKRANCRPVYAWSYDSGRGRYNLILIVLDYFRNNMNDITDAARRIWTLYSPYPVQFITEMTARLGTKELDKQMIINVLNNNNFTSMTPKLLLQPHQRAFACSKLF